ncbi:MAG: TonB-dependent receptor, partial [Deltaproteobacteria bacterium]|nr:TonB-dependent receptor [Deltaproteobacteria bacterium]
MNSKSLFKAFIAIGLLAGPTSLLHTQDAFAQAGATVGSLRGQVKDKANGEAAAGATVVATSPALQGEQVVLADENGLYYITALPPGAYTLTIYYSDKTFSRSNVFIQLGKEAVINVTVDSNAVQSGTANGGKGEIIEIQGSAPIIDQGSTKTGITLTDDYTRNIPTARTFGGVIGSAAGSQGDIYGTSLAGSTSGENTYIVEGINTTDTAFGGLSSNLPNEFIQETEVITGGYNAEFGRATGGVINVVTKSGSNELKGSVFGYYRPGSFVSDAKQVAREGGSIASATNLDYNFDVGAELGGPIIKDKLWFHVGINPSLTKRTTTRTVQSQVDKNDDGVPDTDNLGFTVHEDVSKQDIEANFKTYFYTAKINGAVNANNQFQISAFGNPRQADDLFAVTRNPAASKWAYDDGAYDLAGKWTSKLNDGKTQIDAVLGFHRGYENQKPFRAADNVSQILYRYDRSLYDFSDLEGAGIGACQDDVASDMYMSIRNCPVNSYSEQGLGFLEERTNDRQSVNLALTQRVKAAGYHTFKVGGEIEVSTYDSTRYYTGGQILSRSAADTATVQGRWVQRSFLGFDRAAMPDEVLATGEVLCAGDRSVCSGRDKLVADTTSRSLGAYAQDSWQIRPNFAVNLGLRYEQQVGYAAEALQGKPTPEGEVVPDRAFTLNG